VPTPRCRRRSYALTLFFDHRVATAIASSRMAAAQGTAPHALPRPKSLRSVRLILNPHPLDIGKRWAAFDRQISGVGRRMLQANLFGSSVFCVWCPLCSWCPHARLVLCALQARPR
jgi:hypothetical protein